MTQPLQRENRETNEHISRVEQPTNVLQMERRPTVGGGPERQAYQALRLGFTVAPILAGADKYFNLLTNWDQYVAPVFPRLLGLSMPSFMMGAGAIEIIAGIGVALKPKIFGYVVSAWLLGIIVNLLIMGQYYDIALRDLGLSIGAFALARLATHFERSSYHP